MLDAYLAQIARRSTVNQFNQLHISLENVLSPAEVCAIVDGARSRGVALPPEATHWLSRMDELLRKDGRAAQPYARQTLGEAATAYAAPGTPAERARRTFVIAFTGDAHRLMMPVSLFLQACPADRYELLVLSDFRRSLYLRGIAGLGDDFPSAVSRIGAMAPSPRDRRVVSLGTSAGGLASVWAAVELGLARAVSVGGVTPEQAGGRYQTQGLSTEAFEESIRRHAARLPEVLLVSGEQNDRDQRKALSMADRLPATLVAVPGCAHHNVLYDLWTRGELEPFLARSLG